MALIGKRRRGKSHRLTEADVLTIRDRLSAGETQKAVGADYGIGQQTISHISRRTTWKHLPARTAAALVGAIMRN